MNLFSMLNADKPVAEWVSTAIPIIQTIFLILIVLFSIAIIVSVLFSPSDMDNGNAITGYNDSFYSHNKGFTREGRLKRVIIVSAICILVLSLLYFLSFFIYKGAL